MNGIIVHDLGHPGQVGETTEWTGYASVFRQRLDTAVAEGMQAYQKLRQLLFVRGFVVFKADGTAKVLFRHGNFFVRRHFLRKFTI